MLDTTPERAVWSRVPIRVVLPVGVERRVVFPASVQVGMPPDLGALLRTQSLDGTVYWLAHRPFGPVRVQVVEVASGNHYLLDLEARPEGPAGVLEVVRGADASAVPTIAGGASIPAVQDDQPDAGRQSASSGVRTASESAAARPAIDYVTLTRFAARQLYGPERLARPLPGVHRVPVGQRADGLIRGGRVEALPLVAWRGGGYHLTAVKLTNATSQPVILDPRDLRGAWLAATFQHARILPRGEVADTTTVYLISAGPFADAMRGAY